MAQTQKKTITSVNLNNSKTATVVSVSVEEQVENNQLVVDVRDTNPGVMINANR